MDLKLDSKVRTFKSLRKNFYFKIRISVVMHRKNPSKFWQSLTGSGMNLITHRAVITHISIRGKLKLTGKSVITGLLFSPLLFYFMD